MTCSSLIGNRIVSGSRDTFVSLWDLTAGKKINTIKGIDSPITCVQFDDSKLVVGTKAANILVYSLRFGIKTFKGHTKSVQCLQVTLFIFSLLKSWFDELINLFYFKFPHVYSMMTQRSCQEMRTTRSKFGIWRPVLSTTTSNEVKIVNTKEKWMRLCLVNSGSLVVMEITSFVYGTFNQIQIQIQNFNSF